MWCRQFEFWKFKTAQCWKESKNTDKMMFVMDNLLTRKSRVYLGHEIFGVLENEKYGCKHKHFIELFPVNKYKNINIINFDTNTVKQQIFFEILSQNIVKRWMEI